MDESSTFFFCDVFFLRGGGHEPIANPEAVCDLFVSLASGFLILSFM